VEVNGVAVNPQRVEESNQMVAPVPAGVSRVRVHFDRTFDRRLGGDLSIVSLFVLLVISWVERAKRSRS
jgi:hypothetical protein